MDTLTIKDYIPRIADTEIREHLQVFGAVVIEGPKWCGKMPFVSNAIDLRSLVDSSLLGHLLRKGKRPGAPTSRAIAERAAWCAFLWAP